jgi:hypothetical protein
MSSKKFFYVMIGVTTVLAFGIFASAFVGNSLLQKQSHKLANLKLDSVSLDEQQTALIQANKDVSKYSELENIAKSVVPQDKDQAEAVREIVKIADDSGIKLANISFPASTLGQTPGASGSSSTSAGSGKVTQVSPVKDIPGVYSMNINIQQDTAAPVSYSSLINFLSRLEQNRRTSQVTSVTVQPLASDRTKLNFTLVVEVYIKP